LSSGGGRRIYICSWPGAATPAEAATATAMRAALNVFILSSMCRRGIFLCSCLCVCVCVRVCQCVCARTSHGFAFLLQLFVIISFFARRLQCISFSLLAFFASCARKNTILLGFFMSECVCWCVCVCVFVTAAFPSSTS